MDNAFLAILILFPVATAYFLRSNGALSFLALSGGFAAMTLSGSDIIQLIGKTKITSLTSSNVDLALLGLPLLLTLLLSRKSAPISGMWRYLHLTCALLAGVLLAIVAAPMLSDLLNTSYSNSVLWKDLQRSQSYVVSAGLLLSLGLIWLSSSKNSSKKHR